MARYTLNKYISRLTAVLLCILLLIPCIPVAWADGESGSCGDNLSWSLSAGTLTITGSGVMEDFPESTMAPWYSLREEILRLSLPEGLTTIGALAFYECENLTTVTIPASVTSIGQYAFAQCTELGLLNLGSGIKRIDEAAFSDCYQLASLRLPEGLQSLGVKAFYRCESIPTVSVPSSVTKLGMSAFAYCKSLVSANIQASISVIPEYLFYGCANLTHVSLPDSASGISDFAFRGCGQLNTVRYQGKNQTPDQIRQQINKDVPGFDGTGFVTDSTPDGNSFTAGVVTDHGDGSLTQQNTTVTDTGKTTVTTVVGNTRPEEQNGGEFTLGITVTVDDEEGWEELGKVVEGALKDYDESVTITGGTSQSMTITVYNNTTVVPPEFLEQIEGRDITVTIITKNGSQWVINGLDLVENNSEQVNLTYELSPGSKELCEKLGVTACYVLKFLEPAQVNAQVQIRLGKALTMRTATLIQDDKNLTQVQSVVVDQDGNAGFYLGAVTDEMEYYIAIDLPKPEKEPIVPQSLQQNFGATEKYRTIEYEITGRTSSWGMEINQVTWILVAVMLGSVVIVGAVLFVWNKRRLKRGYIPSLDDEDV